MRNSQSIPIILTVDFPTPEGPATLLGCEWPKISIFPKYETHRTNTGLDSSPASWKRSFVAILQNMECRCSMPVATSLKYSHFKTAGCL